MSYKHDEIEDNPYLVYTSEPDTTYEPAQDDADNEDDNND